MICRGVMAVTLDVGRIEGRCFVARRIDQMQSNAIA